MATDYKVKLVAIAKDEAAYLAEWIFHHLHFGFDAIDVYVNNTTDNTYELASLLSTIDSVTLIDGDEFFYIGAKGPQQKVYNEAFFKAKKAGFTHIMFLDIDEFWTPINMHSTVKDCLSSLNADVISFEWLNKVENDKYSPVIESNIIGEHHCFVKSMMSLDLSFERLDIHNVTAKNAVYVLSDGSIPIFNKTNQKLVTIDEIKPYIIIHRMYRSSFEYVSLLGRGRPKGEANFKDNRNGFCFLEYELKTVKLSIDNVIHYHKKRDCFFEDYISPDYLECAYQFIEERYKTVIRLIESASIDDLYLLKKTLKNVNIPEVNSAFSEYLQSICTYLAGGVTDALRDGAIALEKRNVGKSLSLMKVAHSLRPKGKLIVSKVEQYENIINSKKC